MGDWLAKKYPGGVGLGDLICEYLALLGQYDEAGAKKRDEVKVVLNYLNSTKVTPTFSKEGELLIKGVKLGEL